MEAQGRAAMRRIAVTPEDLAAATERCVSPEPGFSPEEIHDLFSEP